MKANNFYSLKDFELSSELNITQIVNQFQRYIDQLDEMECINY